MNLEYTGKWIEYEIESCSYAPENDPPELWEGCLVSMLVLTNLWVIANFNFTGYEWSIDDDSGSKIIEGVTHWTLIPEIHNEG